MKRYYPLGNIDDLIKNVLLIHLPALRCLDLGMNYRGDGWPSTIVISSTYLYATCFYKI